MKAFSQYPKKKQTQRAPGLLVGSLGRGEVIKMCFYFKDAKHMAEFTATVCGASANAIKFVATHGPKNAGREEFFWLPKAWDLTPVPKRAHTYYLPEKKCAEIGTTLVMSFNI